MDPSSLSNLLFAAWPHVTPTVALAVVALLGYWIGRRNAAAAFPGHNCTRLEIKRAESVLKHMERISGQIRGDLADYETKLAAFRRNLQRADKSDNQSAWKQFSHEAETLLRPTMGLANKLARSYDEIRQQGNQLMTFTEIRTDPLTGVSNRRALDEALVTQFALFSRYDQPFSLAIFDIDYFKQVNDAQGHLGGDRVLQALAKLLDQCARETDMVARFGGEEFVVLMPQTQLEGACSNSERLRERVEQELEVTVSGGIAEAAEGETPDELLDRADAALYQAKRAGRNRLHVHSDGEPQPLAETELAAV